MFDAENLLSNAVERDPGYAQAYSLLSYCRVLDGVYGWKPYEASLNLAWEAANKAALLDIDDAWSHFAHGAVAFADGLARTQ